MTLAIWMKAVVYSCLVFGAVMGPTTLLAARDGWAQSGFAPFVARVVGFLVAWLVILLVEVTPIVVFVSYLRRGRVTRLTGALIGAGAAVAPYLAVMFIQSGWRLFALNMQELAGDPVRLLVDWCPFVAGGSVFGWVGAVSRE